MNEGHLSGEGRIVSQANATSLNKTRRQRVELKEEAIVETARRLFNEKGFGKTTISGIAKGCGVADGTVYLYFKNKEALAQAVLEAFYRDLKETAQDGVDALDSTEEQLRFLAEHHLTKVNQERRILELLPIIGVSLDNYKDSKLFTLNKSYARVFDRVAKSGVKSGVIKRDLAPWVLRDVFYGGLDYASRTMMMHERTDNFSAVVDGLMAMMLVPKSAANSALEDVAERFDKIAERIEKSIG